MDAGIKLLQQLALSLNVQQKANFLKYPLLIMWLSMPLALWGYIQTQNTLLYLTFIGLIILNSALSFICFQVISKQNEKEVLQTFKALDKSINNLIKRLTVFGNAMQNKFFGEDMFDDIKPEPKKISKSKKGK